MEVTSMKIGRTRRWSRSEGDHRLHTRLITYHHLPTQECFKWSTRQRIGGDWGTP